MLVGKRVHEMERDFVRDFAVDKDSFDRVWKEGYAEQTL